MAKVSWIILMSCVFMFGCKSGDKVDVVPKTEEFTLDPEKADQLAEAAKAGNGAEASYTYDESGKVLTLVISATNFECGIEAGTMDAVLTEAPTTTMDWQFTESEIQVSFVRVDEGATGVVGIWKTDPDLYLILMADGTAQVLGEFDECGDDES